MILQLLLSLWLWVKSFFLLCVGYLFCKLNLETNITMIYKEVEIKCRGQF